MDKYSVLKETFGYTTFREDQEELVDALLSGRDSGVYAVNKKEWAKRKAGRL